MPREALSPEGLAKSIRKSSKKYEKQRITLGKAAEEWEAQRQVCGGSHIDFALHLLAIHRAYCSYLHHQVKPAQRPQEEGGENQSRLLQPTTRHQQTTDQHRLQGSTTEKAALEKDELTVLTQSANRQTTSIKLEAPQQATHYNSLEAGNAVEHTVVQHTVTKGLQGVSDGVTIESLCLRGGEGSIPSQGRSQVHREPIENMPQLATISDTHGVQSHITQRQTSNSESQNVMFPPSGQETSSQNAAMAHRLHQAFDKINIQIKYTYWCVPCQQLLQIHELKVHILSHFGGQLVQCAACVEGFSSEGLVLKHLLKHMGLNMRLLRTKSFTKVDNNVNDKVKQLEMPPLRQDIGPNNTLKAKQKVDINQSSVLPAECLTSSLAPSQDVDLQGLVKENIQPVKCRLCGEGFKYREHRRKHLPLHDKETPYKCCMCDKYFTTQDILTKHQTKLCDALEFACRTCHKVFKRKERLDEHELSHNKGPYICGTCGKVYKAQMSLTIHKYKHTGQWPHKCTICDKGYATNGELTKHMGASHYNTTLYSCQICGKGFMRRYDVHLHQQTHQTDRPFICSICGKTFKRRSSAQNHERGHNPERKHQCIVCGQGFKQRANLTRHMSTHSGERNHQCTTCGKLFGRRWAVEKHMLTHTQERPHTCEVCGESFRQNSHLVTHMMRHTGEWSHPCSLCEKGFGNPGHLSKHMATKHNST